MTLTARSPLEASVTYAEIAQQPTVWRELEEDLDRHRDALRGFLDPLLARADLRIVLAGAGTSAFVGKILAPALSRRLRRRVDAVATTDLVADPWATFADDAPTLLVSFARSGDSPESVAATELADRCLGEVHHLVVTCNPHGRLATDHAGRRSSLIMLMPAASNDRGFAMTSSFTSMLLGTWEAFTGERRGAALAAAVASLVQDLGPYAELAERGIERVVYLGSGPLAGLAQESALKLLELTAGRVVAYHDTALGFRHGPKSVLDERTLVVVFCSTDPYTARYDADIVTELRSGLDPWQVITVGSGGGPPTGDRPDWTVDLGGDGDGPGDAPLAAAYVVTAQLLALHLSVAHGCTPDNPFPSGAVNRVVEGVTVHPLD